MHSRWRRFVLTTGLATTIFNPWNFARAQEFSPLPILAWSEPAKGGKTNPLDKKDLAKEDGSFVSEGVPLVIPLGQELLQGPILTTYPQITTPPLAGPLATAKALPINLATALQLANARPLIIAAAQASVKVALADLQLAKVMWLPDVYVGPAYYRHDGGSAGNSGQEFTLGRDQLLAGYGLTAIFSVTDAIFGPLALKQVIRSREADVQTARNDALLNVVEAYFNVQQARGRYAGAHDAAEKGRELARNVLALSKDLVPPVEVNRVRAQLAEVDQAETQAYEDWRVASAMLNRELRLAPATVVVPLEPPHLQVTLFSPQQEVDPLITVGLTSRPELASQQALVQSTLIRLRQEKLRPLIPSVVLEGNPVPAAPGGTLMGGVFLSDVNGQSNPTTFRNDVSVQLLWELRNLGFGNLALVNQRKAELERSFIELYRVQDRVAEEIAEAHAQMQSAATRICQTTTEVKEAQISYKGNVKGLSETSRAGDILVLAIRPQEAVAALSQLLRAYDNYYRSVSDYNRAQFRLYRALGYPAGILECERITGDIIPVDTTRPAKMAPVNTPPPCACPH